MKLLALLLDELQSFRSGPFESEQRSRCRQSLSSEASTEEWWRHVSLSMHAPSSDSATVLMTCLKQHCEDAQREGGTLSQFTTDSHVFWLVGSGHVKETKRSQETAMEPITATVVIVALVALAC